MSAVPATPASTPLPIAVSTLVTRTEYPLPRPRNRRFRKTSQGYASQVATPRVAELLASWPLVRQVREGDALGLGKAVRSERSAMLKPRIDDAERVVASVCPYCAVGCGQLVYVKDGEITHIDGDPSSPISRGRLCPKGQASKSYVK